MTHEVTDRMPDLPVRLLLVGLFSLAFLSPAHASGVTGRQQLTYSFDHPVPIPPYENSGYQLEVLNDNQVRVTADISPFRNATSYPCTISDPKANACLTETASVPDIPIPDQLRRQMSGQKGYVSAVETILTYVGRRFRYGQPGHSPFRGDCNTLTETTISLMTAFGIPARRAVFIVMEQDRKTLSGPSLHSTVEIFYPGSGWMFSDPAASHHFVPASYIRLPDADPGPLLGLEISRKGALPELRHVGILLHSNIPKRINLFRFE